MVLIKIQHLALVQHVKLCTYCPSTGEVFGRLEFTWCWIMAWQSSIEWIIRPELLIMCFSETLVQSHDIDVVNNQFIPDWSTSINQWKKKTLAILFIFLCYLKKKKQLISFSIVLQLINSE